MLWEIFKYIIKHQRICALASEEVNSNKKMVKQVFLKNLYLYISKYILDKYCKTIKNLYRENFAAEQKSKVVFAAFNKHKNN